MKRYDQLDPWELLGLAPGATAEEVRTAYERLSARLAPGSLAFYSIAEREEQDALQRRLRAAYLELLDAVAAAPRAPEAKPPGGAPVAVAPAAPASSAPPPADAGAAEAWDGALLRRTRETLGVSLEALSHRTRIRANLLSALEEERFGALPQRVFVRGFVIAVARELGLDPEKAWGGYGARWEAWAAAHR